MSKERPGNKPKKIDEMDEEAHMVFLEEAKKIGEEIAEEEDLRSAAALIRRLAKKEVITKEHDFWDILAKIEERIEEIKELKKIKF